MRARLALLVCLCAVAHCGAQTPAAIGGFLQGDFMPSEHPVPETISAARLRHKTPAKALAAFGRGVKLYRAGAWGEGAREFLRAIDLDPAFPEAHCNLGVARMVLHSPDEAARELRLAIDLDPGVGLYHSNLAAVFVALKRLKEAEDEARSAVALDGSEPIPHYLLGTLLARRPEARDAAVEQLAYACRQIPEANLALSMLYRSQGEGELAAAAMERYRKAVEDRDRRSGGACRDCRSTAFMPSVRP